MPQKSLSSRASCGRKLLTLTQYAVHRGVTENAVRQAIQQGRISSSDGLIDQESADEDWARNTHPAGHGGQNRGKTMPKGRRWLPSAGQPGVPPYSDSRNRRAAATAKLAEIEVSRRSGELVSLAVARADEFKLNRRTRDMLLALPDRLAPRLSGLDQFEIQRILTEEVRRMCSEIAGCEPL